MTSVLPNEPFIFKSSSASWEMSLVLLKSTFPVCGDTFVEGVKFLLSSPRSEYSDLMVVATHTVVNCGAHKGWMEKLSK